MKYCNFFEELEKLKLSSQYRSFKSIIARNEKYIDFEDKRYLNLSSNDYLGLAGNKDLCQNLLDSLSNNNILQKFGLSSSSSRLLTGNFSIYDELESELAKLYQRESSLVFNSGYHANTGVISALCKRGDLILCDKQNHASIIDGMKLSGADFFRYKHLDYQHLENLLEQKRDKYKQAFIISESIFSMDGDKADLKKLVDLKNKYNAILIIDEAHAFGVFGDKGLGVCEENSLIQDIDIIIGTFGKAAASIGAFAILDNVLKEYLVNKSRSLIFTTALPPVNVFWTLNIIKLIPELKEQRKHLNELSNALRNSFQECGIKILGESQIIPAIFGDNDVTVKISEKLKYQGFWILPIRPPTVPVGTSRLRISLTAALEWDDIKDIASIIRE